MLSKSWLQDVVTILARHGFAVVNINANVEDAQALRAIQDDLLKLGGAPESPERPRFANVENPINRNLGYNQTHTGDKLEGPLATEI